ncbi:MAG: BACON domain-containing protein, partial [Bryobacteraceae bacterium]
FSSDYPTTLGAYSTNYSGNGDMFVTKLASDGTLVYSTYIGGELEDIAWSVTVDGSGRALVGGETASVAFPVTVGAVQPQFAGGTDDGAVCALDSAGSSLVLCTYLGGSESDYVTGVNYDVNGIAIAVGATWSTDFATAIVNSTATLEGSSYAFVSQLPNSANACSFTLTPSSASVSATPGSAALSVAAGIITCAWSAIVNTSWLHMNVLAGVGNVQLTYSWDANTGGPRTGSIDFGNVSFTVSQDGAVSELTVGPLVPSAETGDTATFSSQITFSGGTAGISTVELLVSSAATATAHACHIQYRVSGSVWYLQDDGGANWLPLGAGASVENTQCRLDSAGLSVASIGATMTATVPVVFKVGYFGAQNVYLLATATNGSTTGFQLAGTWFVDHPPDLALFSNSSAVAGPLLFWFHDPDSQYAGRNDIAAIEALIGEAAGPNCWIKYDLVVNLLYLWNSAASNWLPGVGLGTSIEPITNGICTVDVAGSGVGVNYIGITPSQSTGDSSTVMILSVSFASTFTGAHSVYLRATDIESLNSGLLNVGIWTTH